MPIENLKVGVGTREYSFEFVVSDAQRLKAAGIDVFNAKKYQALFADVLKQLDLLTEFLKPQLEKFGVTELQFCDDLVREPEAYGKCLEAFVAGLENFFQNLRQESMVKVLRKARQHMEMAEKARMEKLDDPRIDLVAQKEIEKVSQEADTLLDQLLSGTISLTALESSESNPGDGPTGN
jgi:hypothetical protein